MPARFSRSLVLFGEWELLEKAQDCHRELCWIWSLETDEGRCELFKRLVKKASPIEAALETEYGGGGGRRTGRSWTERCPSFSRALAFLQDEKDRQASKSVEPLRRVKPAKEVATVEPSQIQHEPRITPQAVPSPSSSSTPHPKPISDRTKASETSFESQRSPASSPPVPPPGPPASSLRPSPFFQLILEAKEMYESAKREEDASEEARSGSGKIDERKIQEELISAMVKLNSGRG